MAMASRQDLLLGSVTLEKIVLGSPPGTSKASTTIVNDKNVSNGARANQLAMARRLDDRAEEMRNKLVQRVATTSSRKDYTRNRKEKKKKNALRPMTREEEERALLEPLEFVSKRSLNPCCGRVVFTELTGPGAAATRLFKLTDQDLTKIKKSFDFIDADESGSITQSEFFECLELKDTPFTRELCNSIVFEIADSDQNNSLTFDEFVLGVSIVCTLTRDQLLYFVFRCFDVDNSGILSQKEFVDMSIAINEAGGGFFDGNFVQLIDKFDQNKDGSIDFPEFLLVDSYFPMAFFPVFRMQDQLRKKTLGAKWQTLVMEYDAREHKRCVEETDLHNVMPIQRPFVERMVKLGAMDHLDQGGFHDLRRASLEKEKRFSESLAQSDDSMSLDSHSMLTFESEQQQQRQQPVSGQLQQPQQQQRPLNHDGSLSPISERGEPNQVHQGPETDNSTVDTSALSVVFEGFGDSNEFNRPGPGRGDSQGFKVSLDPTHSFRSFSTFSPSKVNNNPALDRMTSAPSPFEDGKKPAVKKKGILSSMRQVLTGRRNSNASDFSINRRSSRIASTPIEDYFD